MIFVWEYGNALKMCILVSAFTILLERQLF